MAGMDSSFLILPPSPSFSIFTSIRTGSRPQKDLDQTGRADLSDEFMPVLPLGESRTIPYGERFTPAGADRLQTILKWIDCTLWIASL